MKILLVGATGLVGDALRSHLVAQGHEVWEAARHRPKARRDIRWIQYHRLFWTWFAFGFPAFAAVLAIVWLMMAKPVIPFIDS